MQHKQDKGNIMKEKTELMWQLNKAEDPHVSGSMKIDTYKIPASELWNSYSDEHGPMWAL